MALCRIRETKTAGHGVPRFSRITISRRCRHDTRCAHAFHRAKAIFRSNMIIKSNGIRNSSAARILSTSSSPLFTPSHPPCRLLRSTHVFARMGQGMRFALHSSFSSLSLSPLSFSVQAYWHRYPRVGGIGKPRGSFAKKMRWKKEEYIKDGSAHFREETFTRPRTLECCSRHENNHFAA